MCYVGIYVCIMSIYTYYVDTNVFVLCLYICSMAICVCNMLIYVYVFTGIHMCYISMLINMYYVDIYALC